MNRANHITTGDVLDDLGFSRSESAALKIKASLLEALLAEIDRRRLTQKQLVRVLDEYQPNISNLLHGRISKVSIEKLLGYAERLSMQSRIELRPSVRSRAGSTKRVASAKRSVYA